MSTYLDKRLFIFCFALLFIFACSAGTSAPAAPQADETKIALEVQATVMALQLTQPSAALAAEATQVPPQATQTPSVTESPPTETPALREDFTTWMKSAHILLFEDMAGATDRRRIINQALNGMGLQYTDVADALGRYKNEILNSPNGTGWDLIISGKELREGVQGEFYEYLNTAINAGSSVIIEEWNMNDIFNGKLSLITSRCGVSFEKNWTAKKIEAQLLFPIEDSSPILHSPNDGISLTNPTNYWIGGDLGDRMKLDAGSNAIPLWGLYPSERNSALTAVSCIDGRVIIQTYSSHSYGEDRIIRMWQNYIYHTLKARYDYLAAQ